MRLSVSLSACVLLFGTASCKDPEPKPNLQVKLAKIKAADVEKAIAAHKGKVVLLDVWGEF